MAGQIEEYLFNKLELAIEETKSTEHCLSTVLFGLHGDFEKLKNLLKDKSTAIKPEEYRENLYLLNNLLTQWQLISKGQSIYSPEALAFAYKLDKRLKEISKKLEGGEGSGKGEGSSTTAAAATTQDAADVSLTGNLDTYRWSSRTVDPSKVHGFEDKERFLERLLLRKESKNGFKAFAIVGMTGVGKTTLCQLIFNNKKVKDHFLPRIWVCLSKQPEDDEDNSKETVKRMLMCLGVDDEIIQEAGKDQNLGLQKLMFALRLQLMGKKYLIVLDDVRKPDDVRNWDECFGDLASESTEDDKCYGQLAYGLPKRHGGTVIITTRSEEIAKKMVGEENLHRLPILKDDEICWKIFKDSVEKDGKKFPENLMPLKDMIVDKCAGLPLAAKMMGEILHQKLPKQPNTQTNPAESQNQQQSQQQSTV
ncbi:probable disease resistance protein At5g45490 [Coffea eugenioides]|uniref:probable disease resistance protein At5g45490 n=1 Tax=Coffea eugenioides TaxID=49369 RepID=UPI000F60B792|nr:probable disease resistance protein At5g45490 [Coffea eugenioides]